MIIISLLQKPDSGGIPAVESMPINEVKPVTGSFEPNPANLFMSVVPDYLENFYKNQLYEGRSGDIICMPQPYCQITKYPTGTSHSSPYDYDTHVPLVLYQQGRFGRQTIRSKVWMQQLPITLAHILGVQRPSASTFATLPGIA